MKSLFKTVSLITFFAVLTRIAGFLFRIFLSRTITAEDLGAYQISFSIFMVLLTFIASGLPLIISRMTAKSIVCKDKLYEQKTITAGLVMSIAISIFMCVIVLCLSSLLKIILSDNRCVEILIILLPALVFSSIYSSIRGNLWGKDDFLSVCATELFEQVVRIIAFFILSIFIVKGLDGAVSSAVSMTIACFASSLLVLLIYIFKGNKFKRVKDKTIYKNLFKQSAPITGVRLATSMIQPLISLIIPARLIAAGYTSSQAVSLFGIATGMTLPLLFIPSTLIGSLSMALIPDLSTAVTKQDYSHIENRITSSLKFTIFISTLFIPLYMGAGEYIGRFFFDNAQSGILLSDACLIMLPMGLTNLTSSILNATGNETKQFKNYILGGIAMLLSIWFLPKYIGIRALIWGFGICFTISAILNMVMLKKTLNCKMPIKKDLILQCIFILPTASLCSFLCNILCNYINLFFNLAITCSISAVFYILLCAIFNLIDIKSFFVTLKNRTKVKRKKVKKA